jgi:hypothetical protein
MAMEKPNPDQRSWEDVLITKVEDRGAFLELDMTDDRFGSKMVWSLEKKYGATPKAGDKATLINMRGSMVVGLLLNGELIYEKTDDEIKAEDEKRSAEYKAKLKEDFEKSKDYLDGEFEKLPEVFQRRIMKFRTNNPDFRVEFEGYEMCCCVDALKIAAALKDPSEFEAFAKLDYKDQMERVPGLSDDHSGNSFGMAMKLAYLYLTNPENVVKMHGALAPLVGSEAYGCVPRGSKSGQEAEA